MEISEIIPKCINVSKYAKAEYKLKAEQARLLKESTGGWRLDNGYRNNANGRPAGANAARCVELTEVFARITSIVSLIKSPNQDIDAINMHWRQAMEYFLPKAAK